MQSLHQLSANKIDGTPQPLAAYQGKVLLIVNTASQCGYTPQYAGLEQLHAEYRGKGLEVLGFPSNDFGAQEPGTAQEIASFCSVNYGVSFPLFEKIRTKGDGQSPVSQSLAAGHGGPRWNFQKSLVGRDGRARRASPSNVAPDRREPRDAIDAPLGE